MEIDFNIYPLPKRLRHHTAANMYFPAHELKVLPDYYPPLVKTIDWSGHFKNAHPPQVLDIGCGRGALLLDWALENPQKNILGIEVRKLLPEWINTVAKAYNVGNCSSLWYSVVNGMPFICDSTIENVFYLFPDPWPKKKHFKRRVFSETFLKEISRVLVQDGNLYLATDLEEIHEYHLEVLNASGLFSFSEFITDEKWALPRTNKEKFCLSESIPYYRIICKRK